MAANVLAVIEGESSPRVAVRPASFGKGVFATEDLPANAFVGAYPGRVYRDREFVKMVEEGRRTGEYAVAFFQIRPTGTIDYKNLTIDPTNGPGRIDPRFAASACLYVNEPTAPLGPNLMWVINVVRNRIEMYTYSSVKKGHELLICYGGAYARGYKTSCETAGVTIVRHLIYDEDEQRAGNGSVKPMSYPDFTKKRRLNADEIFKDILARRSASPSSGAAPPSRRRSGESPLLELQPPPKRPRSQPANAAAK